MVRGRGTEGWSRGEGGGEETTIVDREGGREGVTESYSLERIFDTITP